MPILLDKKTSQFSDSNVGTSTAGRSFTTAPMVGSAVVVLISGWNSNFYETSSVTDNKGNSYTLYTHTPLDAPNVCIAVALNVASSGTFTITVNNVRVSANYVIWGAASFSGVAQASANVGTGGTWYNSVTPTMITTAVTPTQDDALVVGVAVNDAAITFSSPTGYTNLFRENAYTLITHDSAYQVLTGASAQTLDWVTSSAKWATKVIALKPIALSAAGVTSILTTSAVPQVTITY